ncbi:MAG: DNA-binding protein [Clostridia bacterium]|nr:DNA-binding protein [Clostridia bacterium]
MAKDMSLTFLYDLYGELLSPRQREIFEGYYADDLSLSELSEAYGITRQGVLQNIRSAEHKLRETEEKLKLSQAILRNRHRAEQIETLAELIAKQGDSAGVQIAYLARQIQEDS